MARWLARSVAPAISPKRSWSAGFGTVITVGSSTALARHVGLPITADAVPVPERLEQQLHESEQHDGGDRRDGPPDRRPETVQPGIAGFGLCTSLCATIAKFFWYSSLASRLADQSKVLAQRLALPKSHVHRLLQTLVDTGYAVQDADRRYRIEAVAEVGALEQQGHLAGLDGALEQIGPQLRAGGVEAAAEPVGAEA